VGFGQARAALTNILRREHHVDHLPYRAETVGFASARYVPPLLGTMTSYEVQLRG
jgi:hypothetical protein